MHIHLICSTLSPSSSLQRGQLCSSTETPHQDMHPASPDLICCFSSEVGREENSPWHTLIQGFSWEHLPKRIASDFPNKEHILENSWQALCGPPCKKELQTPITASQLRGKEFPAKWCWMGLLIILYLLPTLNDIYNLWEQVQPKLTSATPPTSFQVFESSSTLQRCISNRDFIPDKQSTFDHRRFFNFPMFYIKPALSWYWLRKVKMTFFAPHYVFGLSFLSYSKHKDWWKMGAVFRHQK